MPLHDWNDPDEWGEFHSYWLGWLARSIKPQLPAGYRARVVNLPTVTLGVVSSRPDVGVLRGPAVGPPVSPLPHPIPAPDFEAEVAVLDPPELSVVVERRGALVAAIEVISRRNKDRPESRDGYTAKYLSCIRRMVNLMIVDVLPRPHGFSFADAVASALQLADQPPTPAPVAVSYKVDGSLPDAPPRLSVWRRPLTVGRPLPSLPLAIGEEQAVSIDLEGTYMLTAADCYLA